MSKRASVGFGATFFLQLALGLFFLMMGIMGLGNYNSRISEVARFFGRDDSLRIITSVVEIVMGLILVAKLFAAFPEGISRLVTLVLFALWALYMLINLFLNKRFMEPNAVVWLYNLSWHSIILAALWGLGLK